MYLAIRCNVYNRTYGGITLLFYDGNGLITLVLMKNKYRTEGENYGTNF